MLANVKSRLRHFSMAKSTSRRKKDKTKREVTIKHYMQTVKYISEKWKILCPTEDHIGPIIDELKRTGGRDGKRRKPNTVRAYQIICDLWYRTYTGDKDFFITRGFRNYVGHYVSPLLATLHLVSLTLYALNRKVPLLLCIEMRRFDVLQKLKRSMAGKS
ncbi:MAG TPA: hypothetical protein VK436_06355 [Methanocella sp.]|nr:hypothetical protein [Methanocella sp.]